MSFRKKIEEGLEQIQQMQEQYRQVREMEILPLSFFSSSYDILRSLTAALHEMEATQLNAMQEQLSKHELMITDSILKKPAKEMIIEEPLEIEPVKVEPVKTEFIKEEKEEAVNREIIEEIIVPVLEAKKGGRENYSANSFLGDAISKNLLTADIKKALSLNDRFRFQRDLFEGNVKVMNDALDQLNNFTSLDDALKFLNDNFEWNWEVEPASAFKEILEKRFL